MTSVVHKTTRDPAKPQSLNCLCDLPVFLNVANENTRFRAHNQGRNKPENLLDVVDRRTIAGMFRECDLNQMPADVDQFLADQSLITDSELLAEIRSRLLTCPQDPLHG